MVVLFLFVGLQSVEAQTQLDDVNREKIEYKTVLSFLDRLKADGVETFEDIRPTLIPDSSTVGFHVIDREYLIKDKVSDVWNHYANCDLQESWNNGGVHMALAYSRNKDSLYYATDTVENLNPGLIVFFDLKLLLGLKNIAMAFEITKVDPIEKLIEYSYIVGNGTIGKQQMFFEETPKGYTLITHLSYYKSKPKTREGIYPHLHAQLINRFHRRMRTLYNQ